MAKPSFVAQAIYDPSEKREHVRTNLTYGFALLFAVILLTYLWAAMFTRTDVEHWTRTKEVMAAILPAVTGSLGIAVGFYFGTQNKS